MKQCTCFALKAINCICAEREDENSFAHWFYGAPHRIKYLRDHPVFLAAQEAWDAAKKQEAEKQEPVAWLHKQGNFTEACMNALHDDEIDRGWTQQPLYTSPPQRQPLTEWIDPNDKTQERFLPNIGEPVLFCHSGTTYYGRHTGGSFKYGAGVTSRHFNTWECRWMYLPAAHGIMSVPDGNAPTELKGEA